MIKKIYLLPLLLLSLVFVACNETEEPSKYDNWRERNEAFIDSLQRVVDSKSDPELEYLVYAKNKKYNIFYKKLKNVPDGQRPVFTSTVSVFYRGMLINEKVFTEAALPKYYTKLYKQLDVFDSNTMSDDDPTVFDSPATWAVNSFYSGGVPAWTDILQNMRVGERWEVYIPWQVAYGESGSGSILGYSTLIFDMILLRIDKY